MGYTNITGPSAKCEDNWIISQNPQNWLLLLRDSYGFMFEVRCTKHHNQNQLKNVCSLSAKIRDFKVWVAIQQRVLHLLSHSCNVQPTYSFCRSTTSTTGNQHINTLLTNQMLYHISKAYFAHPPSVSCAKAMLKTGALWCIELNRMDVWIIERSQTRGMWYNQRHDKKMKTWSLVHHFFVVNGLAIWPTTKNYKMRTWHKRGQGGLTEIYSNIKSINTQTWSL